MAGRWVGMGGWVIGGCVYTAVGTSLLRSTRSTSHMCFPCVSDVLHKIFRNLFNMNAQEDNYIKNMFLKATQNL